VDVRTFEIAFHKIKFLPLDILIQCMFAKPELVFNQKFEVPLKLKLTVDYSQANTGGFKTAYMAQVDLSPFVSKTLDVCVKQAHNLDKKSMSISLSVLHVGLIIVEVENRSLSPRRNR
jgi:hypothetical protein